MPPRFAIASTSDSRMRLHSRSSDSRPRILRAAVPMSSTGRFVRGVAGFAIVFALAEVISRLGLISPRYLPPFSQSFVSMFQLLSDSAFLAAVGSTLVVSGIGLAVAVLVSVPVGLLLGSSNIAYESSRSLIDFIRPIPALALLPVAILVLGSGDSMKIALILFSASWPILFNTIYGVHSVDKTAKETARTFGMGRLRILWKVALPSALPLAYTGIRLAATMALLITVGLEILVGSSSGGGVGAWLVGVGASYGTAELLYGGVILLGLMGWALNFGLVALGRKLFGWHVSVRMTR